MSGMTWSSRLGPLQAGQEWRSFVNCRTETWMEIAELQEQIRGVEQRGQWPKSYAERDVQGHEALLRGCVTDELLRYFGCQDPASPLRRLTRRSTMRELKELLSLEDVRRQLWVDLVMAYLKLPAWERRASRMRDGALWDEWGEPRDVAPRDECGERDSSGGQLERTVQSVGAAERGSASALKMARRKLEGMQVPAEAAAQVVSSPSTPMPPQVAKAVREGHSSWSLVSERVVLWSAPAAAAERLVFVNRGCTVHGTPQVLDGTAWLKVSVDALCGLEESSGQRVPVTEAWICVDGASVGLGGHLLEPDLSSAQWQRSAARQFAPVPVALEEEADWVVVHPLVYLRAEPSTSAAALAQAAKGCIFRGAQREFGGVDWLKVRLDWVQHSDALAMMDGAAWMLIDGSSMGLGALLAKAPVAEVPANALADRADEDSRAPAQQTRHIPDGYSHGVDGGGCSANDGALAAATLFEPAEEDAAGGEGATEAEDSEWEVVHNVVILRAKPSIYANKLGHVRKGRLVRGIAKQVDGVGWLLVPPRVDGGPVAIGGLLRLKVESWILIHGACLGLGQLLAPVGRQPQEPSEPLGRQPEEGGTASEGRLRGEPDDRRGASGGLDRLVPADAGACEDEDAAPDSSSAPLPRLLPSASQEKQATGGFRVGWVDGRGYALFATRSFRSGECILQELPFFTRPKLEHLAKRTTVLQGAQWSAAFKDITESLPAAGEHLEAKIYASPAMAGAAIGYARAGQEVREAISNLHCPDLQSSHPLVVVARRVARLCGDLLPECGALDVAELHRAILAVEMNVFAGGQIFREASRMNHSCLPNVVSVAEKKGRSFRALRPIAEGEELLHSYLGKELLLPTEVRQHHLWRSKCFRCDCERCASETDEMRAVQCRRCAASCSAASRAGGGDPRRDLEAIVAFLLQPNKSHLGSATLFSDIRQTTDICDDIDPRLWLPAPELFRGSRRPKSNAPSAAFRCGAWRCERCGQAPKDEELFLETERLLSRLAERAFLSPKMTVALGNVRSGVGTRIPLKLVQNSYLCGAVDLAAAVSGVLGTRHWAVQWARLLFVDLMISRLDYMGCTERLRACTRRSQGEEIPAFILLSLLKELWDWLETMNLVHDPSCFLYSRTREALTLLQPAEDGDDPSCQILFAELRGRLYSSLAQVEVLAMRPLVLQGTMY